MMTLKIHASHDYDVCVYVCNNECLLVCLQTILWHAQVNISAKFGWIREIILFMESGKHTTPVSVHNVNSAHKLACIYAMFLHSQDHILVKLAQIRDKIGGHSGPT